ncbi:unnamed protein product [Schistosoma margrebowiei]|uniref:FAR1 domain-containing protein n=1 Tax=Schistosoma margrebowiei TaxID=48269 RepID=A0AA85AD40_9TREM|nr:unnamed protein product [Schistosoma margrebowiei]
MVSVCSTSCSSDISVDLSDAFQRIILNNRFATWDDFDNALKEFQKTTHTHYIHTESRFLKDVRFKYLFVSFHCTFGHKRKSRCLTMNQKQSKFLNCQSRFRVRLEAEGYVIKSYNMLHNHPCSSSWMVFDPWARRLSSEEEENLKPVILQSQSTDALVEIIKHRTGKQVTAADVKSMKAKLSTGKCIEVYFKLCDAKVN